MTNLTKCATPILVIWALMVRTPLGQQFCPTFGAVFLVGPAHGASCIGPSGWAWGTCGDSSSSALAVGGCFFVHVRFSRRERVRVRGLVFQSEWTSKQLEGTWRQLAFLDGKLAGSSRDSGHASSCHTRLPSFFPNQKITCDQSEPWVR